MRITGEEIVAVQCLLLPCTEHFMLAALGGFKGYVVTTGTPALFPSTSRTGHTSKHKLPSSFPPPCELRPTREVQKQGQT